jgi:hypothetical protein
MTSNGGEVGVKEHTLLTLALGRGQWSVFHLESFIPGSASKIQLASPVPLTNAKMLDKL